MATPVMQVIKVLIIVILEIRRIAIIVVITTVTIIMIIRTHQEQYRKTKRVTIIILTRRNVHPKP